MADTRVVDLDITQVARGQAGFYASLGDGSGAVSGEAVYVMDTPPHFRAVVTLEWFGAELPEEIKAYQALLAEGGKR